MAFPTGKNQKQRIRELEEAAAVAQSMSLVSPSDFSLDTDLSHVLSLETPTSAFISPPCTESLNSSALDSPGENHPQFWPTDPGDGETRETQQAAKEPEEISTLTQTAFHLAVIRGSLPLTKLLIDHGAELERRDSSGNTALHLAAQYRHASLVELLLQRSANSEARDFMGQTPLFSAVRGGDEVAVKLLLDASADINAKDSMGQTVLYVAVDGGSETIARLLLANGANVNA